MERFRAFEDAALLHRVERLDRAEKDLRKKLAVCISRLEGVGRWIRADPEFQQLSCTLKKVREDMRETEEEVLRRRGRVIAKKAA